MKTFGIFNYLNDEHQDILKRSISGLAAGGFSTILLYPLDLIKIRYQVHEESRNAYRSVYHALRSILKINDIPNNEIKNIKGNKYKYSNFSIFNIRYLYQGMSPALYGATISWGLYFFFYEKAKQRYKNYEENLSPSSIYFLSAMEAGILCVPFTNPIWLIKIRMQVQNKSSTKQYKNITDAFRRIIREEGILSLYKGCIPALLLTTHGAFKFLAYEKLKKAHYDHISTNLGVPMNLVIGALSQAFASTVTYPYQVIKARLQQGGERALKYKGTWDCTKKIYIKEGFSGFYKGLTPNLMKVTPSGAIVFAIYEQMNRLMTKVFEK